MDIQLLEDVGLTRPQALTYQTLIRTGYSSAPKLAAKIGESRSNTYKILDKLCDLGLATKDQTTKQLRYFPTSPQALEQLIQRQTTQVNLRGRKLKAAMPDLMNFFFTHSEQPGVQFFQGHSGIKQIYDDQISTGKPILYIRSVDDFRFFAIDELHAIRNEFPKHGITRHAITPDIAPGPIREKDRVPIDISDKAMLLTRSWIDPEDYDSPVEWSTYGNKLAIISYGQEAIGMIIESPQIASSFRKLFKLLDEGIRRRPGYSLRPLRAHYTLTPDSITAKHGKKDAS